MGRGQGRCGLRDACSARFAAQVRHYHPIIIKADGQFFRGFNAIRLSRRAVI